jgi:hypothetical protein
MEKAKILLIEDDQKVITLWGHLFKEIPNVVITTATTLAAARDVLSKIQFDMVFLDGDISPAYGPQATPETLPLFKEISNVYFGKIFFTSNHEPYVDFMRKQYGLLHVEKTEVADFVKNQLQQISLSVSPSKHYYDLSPGNLLVVCFMKNNYGFPCGKRYITEIVNVGPLTLKVAPHIPDFKPGTYRILEHESRLIQGTVKEQQTLLTDYAASEFGAIESGLPLFGGALVQVLQVPVPA